MREPGLKLQLESAYIYVITTLTARGLKQQPLIYFLICLSAIYAGPDNWLFCSHLDSLTHLCSAAEYSGHWRGEWRQPGYVSWLTSSMLFHTCPQRLLTPWPGVFWEPLSAKPWVSLAGMRRRGEKRERGWGRKGSKSPNGKRWSWYHVMTCSLYSTFVYIIWASQQSRRKALLSPAFRWRNCYSKCFGSFNKIV